MPTLKMDGTEFTLKVKQYSKPEIGETYSWSEIEFVIKNEHTHYSISNELLMQEEVDKIINCLQDLIEDKIKEKYTLIFVEPDLEINISPKIVDYTEKGRVYHGTGHGTYDGIIEIIINFWHKGCLIGESYHIVLCFNEVVELLEGLKAEKDGLPLPNKNEKVYLIGVSKMETPEEIIWCYADGFNWDDSTFYFIEDETNQEQIVLEEIRRAYYKNNLPIPLEDIKTIKRRATSEEKSIAIGAWEKYFEEHIKNKLSSNKK